MLYECVYITRCRGSHVILLATAHEFLNGQCLRTSRQIYQPQASHGFVSSGDLGFCETNLLILYFFSCSSVQVWFLLLLGPASFGWATCDSHSVSILSLLEPNFCGPNEKLMRSAAEKQLKFIPFGSMLVFSMSDRYVCWFMMLMLSHELLRYVYHLNPTLIGVQRPNSRRANSGITFGKNP